MYSMAVKFLRLAVPLVLTILPCRLLLQAEETETSQAGPARAELDRHLPSRAPKRQPTQQEDGSTEDNAQATCRLR